MGMGCTGPRSCTVVVRGKGVTRIRPGEGVMAQFLIPFFFETKN